MKKVVFITTLSPDLELDVRQLPLGMGYLVSVIQRERPGRYEIHHVTHRIGRALAGSLPLRIIEGVRIVGIK